MSKAMDFLVDCGVFYVATVQDDQPRVRPFGAVAEINGKVYLATNNQKAVYRQLMQNPKAEISAVAPDGRWIRITGKLKPDDSREAKAQMLKANPGLTKMYSLDDGIFAVVYLEDAVGRIESFTGDPEPFVIA